MPKRDWKTAEPATEVPWTPDCAGAWPDYEGDLKHLEEMEERLARLRQAVPLDLEAIRTLEKELHACSMLFMLYN